MPTAKPQAEKFTGRIAPQASRLESTPLHPPVILDMDETRRRLEITDEIRGYLRILSDYLPDETAIEKNHLIIASRRLIEILAKNNKIVISTNPDERKKQIETLLYSNLFASVRIKIWQIIEFIDSDPALTMKLINTKSEDFRDLVAILLKKDEELAKFQ